MTETGQSLAISTIRLWGNRRSALIAITLGTTLALTVGTVWAVSAATPSARGYTTAAASVGAARAECWIRLVSKSPARPIVGPWWIDVTDESNFSVKGIGQGYDVQVGDGWLITRGFHGSILMANMMDCDPIRLRLSDDCHEYVEYQGEKLDCLDPGRSPPSDH